MSEGESSRVRAGAWGRPLPEDLERVAADPAAGAPDKLSLALAALHRGFEDGRFSVLGEVYEPPERKETNG